MSFEGSTLIDWVVFSKEKAALGVSFARIVGYFREDGVKCVAAIEEAMCARHAAAMIDPAYMVKRQARQFGATPLADCAEAIEMVARDATERRDTPDTAFQDVVALRSLFEETLRLLEREANPLAQRSANTGFAPRMMIGPRG